MSQSFTFTSVKATVTLSVGTYRKVSGRILDSGNPARIGKATVTVRPDGSTYYTDSRGKSVEHKTGADTVKDILGMRTNNGHERLDVVADVTDVSEAIAAHIAELDAEIAAEITEIDETIAAEDSAREIADAMDDFLNAQGAPEGAEAADDVNNYVSDASDDEIEEATLENEMFDLEYAV
jgi:hypothetical protein